MQETKSGRDRMVNFEDNREIAGRTTSTKSELDCEPLKMSMKSTKKKLFYTIDDSTDFDNGRHEEDSVSRAYKTVDTE